jgi:hypothetical protein
MSELLPTCLLLCGGRGNRLFPLTPSLPRPLLPVASRPLIAFQLDLLEASGFTEVHAICEKQVADEVRRSVMGGSRASPRSLAIHFPGSYFSWLPCFEEAHCERSFGTMVLKYRH